MKKIISLVLIMALMLTFVFAFASCGESKTVVIGYTLYDPMNYEDENGELVGFDTELAKAVFKKLGYTPIFKKIEWGQKYTELNSVQSTAFGTVSQLIQPMMTVSQEAKK